MAQPAPGTAILVHLIMHGGRCKHCCNWRRHGEQSQGGDLQASANLLCGRADCCSFTLPTKLASQHGWGISSDIHGGKTQPSVSPQPVLQSRSWRLAGDSGWVGGPALGELKAQGLCSGVGTGPLLWWTSLSAGWQSPALEVVTLQLSKPRVPATSPAP